MKKLLLIACAMVAMTASAQRKNFSFDRSKHISIENVQMLSNEMATVKTNDVPAMKLAPAVDVIGQIQYIQASDGDVMECAQARITPEEYTISETYTDEEGNEQVWTFDCNVKVELNYEELTIGNVYWVTAYGWYDAEKGELTVPAQVMVDPTGSYGSLYLIGLENEEDTNFSGQHLVFSVEDNGAMFLSSHAAFYVVINEGEYAGYWTRNSWQTALFPVNGEQAGYENSSKTNKAWGQVAYPIAIDDQETSVTVYGFNGFGAVSIDINDDLSVSILTGQPMYDLGLEEADFAIYGYVCFYASSIDGNSLYLDMENPAVGGKLEGNTITIDDEATQGYYWICSAPDESGTLYRLGIYTAQTITLNEGNFLAAGDNDGIDTPTLEERIKSTKTYNLMGQQVDRANYKGLMIRGGKKFINK